MFCENCGAELLPGAKFCEQCGEIVAHYANLKEKSPFAAILYNQVFVDSSWYSKWKDLVLSEREKGNRVGIILTNTRECHSDSYKEIFEKYIAHKYENGVCYILLDIYAFDEVYGHINPEDIDQIISLIKDIYNVAVPDYLMIVGDARVIPSVVWENMAQDGDRYVISDLPYLTFNTQSPWDGIMLKLEGVPSVGRIPASAKNNFVEALRYFHNQMELSTEPVKTNGFGLTTRSWQNLSVGMFTPISEKIYFSPELTIEDFNVRGISQINHNITPNLLYFNLHGSSMTDFWYGESVSHQTDATFSRNSLPNANGYIIGVEACYGAKPTINEENKDSILLAALQNGCSAFVGSCNIAYGSSSYQHASCADIIIPHFLYHVNEGYSYGDSFVHGLKKLDKMDDWDDTSIKTLAQFALYGDPSTSFKNNQQKLDNKTVSERKAFSINMPNIRRAVSLSMTSVTAKIETLMSKYISEHHNKFIGCTPSHYKIFGSGIYQAVYIKKSSNTMDVLKLYYNDSGHILKEYISK